MNIAKTGTRFTNFLLDSVIFNFIIVAHSFAFDRWDSVSDEGSYLLGFYYFILYFGYYYLFEVTLNKSPAKFITTTKVVNSNGEKPTSKEIFIRSLCRLIPFECVSFLFGGRGWHDSISKTQVVDL